MSQSIFDDREKGYEAKFAHDQEMEFRAHVRRDRLFGLWAAEILGYPEPAAVSYAAAVAESDVHPARDETVIARVMRDLAHAAQKIDEAAVRKQFAACAERARQEIILERAAARE
jgi:hypothetical protein